MSLEGPALSGTCSPSLSFFRDMERAYDELMQAEREVITARGHQLQVCVCVCVCVCACVCACVCMYTHLRTAHVELSAVIWKKRTEIN